MNDRSGYTASTLCAVLGVPPATLRAWRNRHALFSTTKAQKGWNYFTLVDFCVAMIAKNLMDEGFQAQPAIDIAEAARPFYDELLIEDVDRRRSINHDGAGYLWANWSSSSGAVVEAVPGDESVDAFVSKLISRKETSNIFANNIGVLIETMHAIIEVVRSLKEIGAEVVLSPRQTEYILFQSLANALEDGKEQMRDEEDPIEDQDEQDK